MGLEEILEAVEAALLERGMSARHASVLSTGSDGLVKRMRQGNSTRLGHFVDLCETLELELYVGPAREQFPVDEQRLELAVETTERALEASGRALTPSERARLQVALYELIGREGTGAARVRTVLSLLTEGRDE